MKNNETISVIVPIYNCAEYIRQCLNSIVMQTYSNLEIVLVDDGSTDGSGLICDEYASRDKRIKVIHKENGGLVSARKAGFDASHSKIIGFVDGDDWIEPNMYEKLICAMDDYEVDVAMCGRYEEYPDTCKSIYHGINEGKYSGNDLAEKVFPRMIVNDAFFEWGLFPSYWDKLFRKEILEEYIMTVDDRIVMGEDAAGVYPCISNANSIFILHECLYHYRQSSTSMVRIISGNPKKERERFRILYHSTLNQLNHNRWSFDFGEQWKKYLLFLMTPRADELYDGIEKLDYLFPFTNIKKGSSIIIYGAGLWGTRLYWYLSRSEFCDVVAIVDKRYASLSNNGFEVISPDRIGGLSHDAVVVTASYAKVRKTIRDYLIDKYPRDTVCSLDEKEVFSQKTIAAFGLL